MDVLHRGSASRAAISRETGLSKPTVSAVVRDLEAVGLLRSVGQASGQVGRSSTLYEVDPTAAYALGIDIGGSKVRAGITDLFGEPLAEASEPTCRDHARDLLTQITDLFERLLAEATLERSAVRAAGISVPGVIHPESDRITAAYNVAALGEMHPRHDFAEALGMPVVIGNDVNLAAAGEQWRGSAVGVQHFVAMSIGTGIGAGIVVDGAVHLGARGAAGEVGWLPLRVGAVDLANTVGGPLEDAASGPAILARLGWAIDDGRATALTHEASLPDVFDAAVAGDALARELVDEEARLLAFAIASVSAVLDPGLVVLGGGLGANPGLLEPVRRHVAAMLPDPPEIVTSTLGDRAAFHGAVAVALDAVREEILREMRANGSRGNGSRAG